MSPRRKLDGPKPETHGPKPGVDEGSVKVQDGKTEQELKYKGTTEGADVVACSNVCKPLDSKIYGRPQQPLDQARRSARSSSSCATTHSGWRTRSPRARCPSERAGRRSSTGSATGCATSASDEPEIGKLLDAEPDWGKIGRSPRRRRACRPRSARGDVRSYTFDDKDQFLYIMRNEETGEILKVGKTTARASARASTSTRSPSATTTSSSRSRSARSRPAVRRSSTTRSNCATRSTTAQTTSCVSTTPRPRTCGTGSTVTGRACRGNGSGTTIARRTTTGKASSWSTRPPHPIRHPAADPPDKDALIGMMAAAQGDVGALAKALKVHEKTLIDWLREHGVRPSDFE